MTRNVKRKLKSRCSDDGHKLNLDRLSDLPDALITQILGYAYKNIDTKYVVRNCVLSKLWRRDLWEYISTLNIYSESFATTQWFENFVFRFLENHKACFVASLSLHNSKVMKSNQLLALRVIEHVVSRGVQDVRLTSTIWNTYAHKSAASCLLASKSLRSLNLENCPVLVTPCCFRFPYLKTLSLYRVKLCQKMFKDGRIFPREVRDRDNVRASSMDVLSNCVSLENLELRECRVVSNGDFIISCPQLVNLEISFTEAKLVIVKAPKLTSFKLEVNICSFIKSNLSLGIDNCPKFHTFDFHCGRYISLVLSHGENFKKLYSPKLFSLFEVFRTAKSLKISMETIKRYVRFVKRNELIEEGFNIDILLTASTICIVTKDCILNRFKSSSSEID
ncbi:hypothetical protein ACFE04_010650 [Oxalis oulophora]